MCLCFFVFIVIELGFVLVIFVKSSFSFFDDICYCMVPPWNSVLFLILWVGTRYVFVCGGE